MEKTMLCSLLKILHMIFSKQNEKFHGYFPSVQESCAKLFELELNNNMEGQFRAPLLSSPGL